MLRAASAGTYVILPQSNYAVCFGSNTMCIARFTDWTTNGTFQANVCRHLSDFTDGTSNTVAVSEVLAGQADNVDHSYNNYDAQGFGLMISRVRPFTCTETRRIRALATPCMSTPLSPHASTGRECLVITRRELTSPCTMLPPAVVIPAA